ncbi:MAG: flagellar assembly protein FliW [Lachnospiraceae bacterium]|nr:flagellar assembly protein FliW [Lachnospiraceae bacterium]
MRVETRLFGEIDIEEDKIITFPNGLVGFPDMKKFTIIYDEDKPGKNGIIWFQSLDEPQFAMPVMEPNAVVPDYNPTVNDELLTPLGKLTEDNLYVLVSVTVPKDITKMSVNLKGPIVINTDTLLANQIVVEDDVQVRFPIYEILKAKKEEKAGE